MPFNAVNCVDENPDTKAVALAPYAHTLAQKHEFGNAMQPDTPLKVIDDTPLENVDMPH
jgi:hypothetical protein